ncbi:hypothetical protein [Candidatus Poriferisodalis sp.]|uniref:hypothetical protein n=1 Tax=Candidatus Poriferisodalis sp. TaxID=3101277 RepID=UPI003B599014
MTSAPQQSAYGLDVVVERLTVERMGPYLDSAAGDLAAALRLYDWNSAVAGAIHADLGRLEVVFRNAVDRALKDLAAASGWKQPWFAQELLFRERQRDAIDTAVQRASRRRRGSPAHGAVISELGFGFWRFICVPAYLTALWVPALASAFPCHPAQGDPRRIRADVEHRMEGLHLLRNRIAHHEPIFRRNLRRDHAQLLELIGWMCADCQTWVVAVSRTLNTIAERDRRASADS